MLSVDVVNKAAGSQAAKQTRGPVGQTGRASRPACRPHTHATRPVPPSFPRIGGARLRGENDNNHKKSCREMDNEGLFHQQS